MEELNDLIGTIGGAVAAVALLGIVLLLPLYISQRRDLLRLRAWMAAEPGHPGVDIARSEAMLDRAEAELEDLLGTPEVREPEPGAPPGTPAAGTTPVPAAYRVTSE
jgi:hypothetical protein